MYAQADKSNENKSSSVTNSATRKKYNLKQCLGIEGNITYLIKYEKIRTSTLHKTIQRRALALTDRPWAETEELASTYAREAVLKGKLNHVPTRNQMIHNLSSSLPSSRDSRKTVMVTEVAGSHEYLGLRVREIGEEWILLGGNPDKEKKNFQCSGENWNQYDEGADVARDLQNTDQREQDTSGDIYEKSFVAHYVGETQPIAIMLLEMRAEDLTVKGKKHLYIRWLLGSPVTKGGGRALVDVAKAEALRVANGELRVDSARSAEGWYEKLGFTKLYNSKHITDPNNEREILDDLRLKDCGCKFMTWTKKNY